MTDSPFFPQSRMQWAWDSTALGWLKDCPRKYQYHMIEGWISKGESVHLAFGILYHSALEHYDRLRHTGMRHDEAIRDTVRMLMQATWQDDKPWRASKDLDMDDKASLKCRENLIRTVIWYLERFKEDPAKTKIDANGKPMVELHFLFDVGGGISLCGYLDRIVVFQNESFVMDRKSTTTTVGSYYFEQFDPDNQMSLYTVASQIAFHTPVKGVIVDAAQIAVGFSRFVRSFVFKAPDQIDEWLRDFKLWIEQAQRYADAGYWPQNDKSCQKFGGCVFREICSKSPSVRDKFLESHFTKRKWNPLELRG